MEALATVPNVTPLRMDVTKQGEVDAVVGRIGAEHPDKGLYALVNNAGGCVRACVCGGGGGWFVLPGMVLVVCAVLGCASRKKK